MNRHKLISELPEIIDVDLDDVFVVEDISAGITKKVSLQNLLNEQTGGEWGQIEGDISDQTDLQNALDDKSDVGHTHDDRYYTEAEIIALLSGKANTSHTHLSSDITDFQTATDARIALQKAQINGLATLDASGKIPTSQLPALAITDTFVALDQTEMLALDAETGDVAVRIDENKSYILQGNDPSVLGDWQELLTPGAPVQSVNGFTGAITLTTTNIGEGTNLYFTTGRAITALTGQNVSLFTNNAGYLTTIAGGDHGGLTGLGDDDHAQYTLLSGRSGGQTIKGGTGITDVLSLVGTSGTGTSGSPGIQFKVGTNGGTVAMTILNSGNVGIGTTTPGNTLTVAGTSNFTGASTFGSTLNGINFLTPNTSSFYAVSGGVPSVTSGTDNTAFGYQALSAVTSAFKNTAFGSQALKVNTGYYNTAVGWGAASANVTGWDTTAIGRGALAMSTVGGNTAVGSLSLNSNTTGGTNTAVGYSSLRFTTTGIDNVGVGDSALYTNTTGQGNVAVGASSMFSNTTGTINAALGSNSLKSNTTGFWNIAIGTNSLLNSTGNRNTALGVNSGWTNITGSNNTFLGQGADSSASNLTNATAIGYGAIVGASNSLILGGTGSYAVNVGIGVTSPSAKTHILGTSEQLRLAYDVSNYISFLVTSVGKLTISSTGTNGDIALTPSGTGAILLSARIRLKGYTVATLPTGTQGDTAYVTDALTPTFLTTVVGGGASVSPVFYNGSAWVAI